MPAIEELRGSNQRLQALLEFLSGANGPVVATPDHLAALLTELLRVGEWLRGGAAARDPEPELAREIQEYRSLVERFRHLMPSVQAQLLTERARLEADRAHLEAASAWAGGSRRTT